MQNLPEEDSKPSKPLRLRPHSVTPPSKCPSCGATMGEREFICMGCGFNAKTGEKITTSAESVEVTNITNTDSSRWPTLVVILLLAGGYGWYTHHSKQMEQQKVIETEFAQVEAQAINNPSDAEGVIHRLRDVRAKAAQAEMDGLVSRADSLVSDIERKQQAARKEKETREEIAAVMNVVKGQGDALASHGDYAGAAKLVLTYSGKKFAETESARAELAGSYQKRAQIAEQEAQASAAAEKERVHLKAEAGTKDKDGMAKLHYAASQGRYGEAMALLRNGATVDIRNAYGATPLHYAAVSGNENMVLLLIGKGANIEARADNGETPLLMAFEAGKTNTISALTASGADTTALRKRQAVASSQSTTPSQAPIQCPPGFHPDPYGRGCLRNDGGGLTSYDMWKINQNGGLGYSVGGPPGQSP